MRPISSVIRRSFRAIFAVARDLRGQRRNSGTLSLRCSQQSSAHHVQIDQAAVHEQASHVLIQAPVTHLGETEDPLENQKRMLSLRPHFRLRCVSGSVFIAQWAVAAAFLVGEVFRLGRLFPNRITLTGIGRIAPDARLLAVQQVTQQRDWGQSKISRSSALSKRSLCRCSFLS